MYMSTTEYIHINELVGGSSAYDDASAMSGVRVVVCPHVSYVQYAYDGNRFVDVWHCENGNIPVRRCGEPSEWYTHQDAEYPRLRKLIASL